MVIQKTKVKCLLRDNGISGLAQGTVEVIDRQVTRALVRLAGRNNSPKRLRPEDIDLFRNGKPPQASPPQEQVSMTLEGECGRCSGISKFALHVGRTLDNLVGAEVTDLVRAELLKQGVIK